MVKIHKEFIKEILNNKFKIIEGTTKFKFTDKIKQDKRYRDLYNWFFEKYEKEGRGIKSIIKDYDLPITYSSLRNLIIFMEFSLHSNKDANNFLKQRRKDNALKQLKEKSGMYSNEVDRHNNKTSRGIQGYYWNTSKNKYVWLRSSWEFIYAKWLNKHKFLWDVEVKRYKLNNRSYLPDFFIYDKNNKLYKIVEIKGYWKDKVYKYNELKEQLNIDLVLIIDISPYLDKKINEEIKIWKSLRRLKLEE